MFVSVLIAPIFSLRYVSGPASSSAVFVSNVPYSVTDEIVKQAFQSRVGPVESVELFMTRSGRPLGTALVRFVSPELAQRAIAECAEMDVGGRPILLREDRGPREPTPRAEGVANGSAAAPGAAAPRTRAPRTRAPRNDAYAQEGSAPRSAPQPSSKVLVRNLDYSVTQEQLDAELAPALAGLVSLKLNVAADGSSKGSALATFATPEDARYVVFNPPQVEVGPRPLAFREFLTNRSSNNNNRAPRRFEGEAAAPAPYSRAPAAAAAPVEGAAEGQRRRRTERAPLYPTEAAPSERVFVGNLPWSLSNEELRDFASTYGPVQSAEIRTLPNGRSRGYAVVVFDSVESATRAIDGMNGAVLQERPLFVYFDRA